MQAAQKLHSVSIDIKRIRPDTSAILKLLGEKEKIPEAHTTEPVDFAVFDPTGATPALRSGGRLADVAPTVLGFLGVEAPEEMTGMSLVVPA